MRLTPINSSTVLVVALMSPVCACVLGDRPRGRRAGRMWFTTWSTTSINNCSLEYAQFRLLRVTALAAQRDSWHSRVCMSCDASTAGEKLSVHALAARAACATMMVVAGTRTC